MLHKLCTTGLMLTAAMILAACTVPGAGGDSGNVRIMVANAYGIEGFDQIEQIQYTFNIKMGERRVQRAWIWWPGADRVESTMGGDTVSYLRSEVSAGASDKLKKIDAAFINDQYWLLFPFHLVWDTQTTVKDAGPRAVPIGTGSARCLIVSYPPSGGYTPGDVYELFLDDNHRLKQWVYRRGGSPEPTLAATWEDHRSVGPITISLEHRRPDKDFRLWFSDVAVKTGSDGKWHKVR